MQWDPLSIGCPFPLSCYADEGTRPADGHEFLRPPPAGTSRSADRQSPDCRTWQTSASATRHPLRVFRCPPRQGGGTPPPLPRIHQVRPHPGLDAGIRQGACGHHFRVLSLLVVLRLASRRSRSSGEDPTDLPLTTLHTNQTAGELEPTCQPIIQNAQQTCCRACWAQSAGAEHALRTPRRDSTLHSPPFLKPLRRSSAAIIGGRS